MPLVNELLETAQSAGAYVVAVAVVASFATMAAMLASWRKTVLDDDE